MFHPRFIFAGGGVLYAVHDDMAVAAFDWAEVARAIGLAGMEDDCR